MEKGKAWFLDLLKESEESKNVGSTDWKQLIVDLAAEGLVYTKKTFYDEVTSKLGLSRSWSDRKLSLMFDDCLVAKTKPAGINLYCFDNEVVRAQHGEKAQIYTAPE